MGVVDMNQKYYYWEYCYWTPKKQHERNCWNQSGSHAPNGMSWVGAQKSQLFSAAGKRSRFRCYRLANTFASKYGLRRDGTTTNAWLLSSFTLFFTWIRSPQRFFRTAKLNRNAFFHSKSKIFYCRFSVSVPIPRTSGTDNRPTTILHLLQSIKNHPTQFHKIPCVFIKFVHNSQFFPSYKYSQIIPSFPGCWPHCQWWFN